MSQSIDTFCQIRGCWKKETEATIYMVTEEAKSYFAGSKYVCENCYKKLNSPILYIEESNSLLGGVIKAIRVKKWEKSKTRYKSK